LAKVLASIKVFPSDISVDLNGLRAQIEKALPEGASVHRFHEEPIAFGLVALIAQILLPEEIGGKMEEVEETLKSLKDVGEIQTIQVTRI